MTNEKPREEWEEKFRRRYGSRVDGELARLRSLWEAATLIRPLPAWLWPGINTIYPQTKKLPDG